MFNKLFLIFSLLFTYNLCSANLNNLRFLEDNLSSNKLEEGPSSPSIRCFWMDLKSFRVYDLKGLKRKDAQKT
jgi:hypothetical protein